MNCPDDACSAEVPSHLRNCVVCGTDAGCPNVRAATEASEVTALALRYKKAQSHARSVGTEQLLTLFSEAVRSSKLVISLPLANLNKLVSDDNSLLGTFYQGVEADIRLPENNEWDPFRQSVDALIFPYYYQEIRFGALSLNGHGVAKFGELSVVLKDTAIRNRSTVFEGNSIEFVRKHVAQLSAIPPGYRAVWDSRDKLAVAKTSTKILCSTKIKDFPTLLMDGDDFIEVHVFGPIHRKAIEKLTGKRPRQRDDRLIFKSIERKAKEVGMEVEVK